jgi:hypothetical protein
MHKPQYETVAIDRMLTDHGHTMIRLPPYHLDLNPTEKIWGIVKTRIAAKMLLLCCEMFSNWQSRILPQWQWKSGLLFADMLNIWKKSA